MAVWLAGSSLVISVPTHPSLSQEHVLEPASRRKLSVHVEGHRPAGAAGTAGAVAEGGAAPAAEGTGGAAGAEAVATAAAAEQAPAEATAKELAAAAGPEPERITELYAWKRRQQLYGSFK